MSDLVWHDKRAVPVFPDNNGGEAWPWKLVKILRDKLLGSKNTVNEKKLTFRLLESQNSHKCCVLISSGRPRHHSPRLWRHFINSREGPAGVSEEQTVRSQGISTSSTSKYRMPPPSSIFFWRLPFPPVSQSYKRVPRRVFLRQCGLVRSAAAGGTSSEPFNQAEM